MGSADVDHTSDEADHDDEVDYGHYHPEHGVMPSMSSMSTLEDRHTKVEEYASDAASCTTDFSDVSSIDCPVDPMPAHAPNLSVPSPREYVGSPDTIMVSSLVCYPCGLLSLWPAIPVFEVISTMQCVRRWVALI